MPYPAQATLCRHVVKSQRRFFLSVPALNTAHARGRSHAPQSRYYSAADLPSEPRDPRVKDLGRAIVDDFAMIRSTYRKPAPPLPPISNPSFPGEQGIVIDIRAQKRPRTPSCLLTASSASMNCISPDPDCRACITGEGSRRR